MDNAMSLRKESLFTLFTGLFLFACFLVFLRADRGFSYDYQYYIRYITEISASTFADIWTNRTFLYVHLAFSDGIEVGFAFLVKILTLLTDDAALIYAMLAVLSLSIKMYVMRSFKIGWMWTTLLMLYSCVYLEANALRSGLSLSMFLLAALFLLQKQPVGVFAATVLSVTIHVQSAGFVLLFVTFFAMGKLGLFRRKWFGPILAVGLLSCGLLSSRVIAVITPGWDKLASYGSYAEAGGSFSTGLNSASFPALLAVCCALWFLIARGGLVKSQYTPAATRLYLLLVAAPTLSVYIFLQDVAVVGDRLWQWGLMLFAVSYLSFSRKQTLTYTKCFMFITLVVALVNITIRYPSSNFFYPLTSYIDFSIRS